MFFRTAMNRPLKHLATAVSLIALTAGSALAQNKGARKAKLPPAPGQPAFTPDPAVPAFDPSKATPDHLDTSLFTVPEGLQVTLWASSPMLFNPANMDVDHAGRVWIAEGINYRRHSGRSREGDCIRVLEDTNGDGKADKSHVFVREKELECPLGVAVFDNVVIVSNAPNLIKYTDINRDLVFDPKVDRREVFLNGFEQPQHDHSLHAVMAGPDGRWYFTNGNCGAYFTDKSGQSFRIGSGYLNNPWVGEPSDDGHVYVGGFAASINPDGTQARILGFNCRNPFEQTKNSLGDQFISDNDDPPACRVSPVIEGGSYGFFSPDGKRQWRADKRPGQDIPTAEWRQDDPGSIPAGDVYGGGAPTGMAFYENGSLGDKWRGLLLACETGRNTVFGYLPKPDGAGFKLERFNFLTTNTTGVFKGSDFVGGAKNLSDERPILFRPSDVCVGPDGAIYVTDWFDQRTGGHQDLDESCSGAIYRIAPKGDEVRHAILPLDTLPGQLAALRSPAVNTRHVGFVSLKARGEEVIPQVSELLKDSNPYVASRAIWLLAQLGEKGQAKVRSMLDADSSQRRLVALRALRAAGVDFLPLAEKMAKDSDAAVRREVAVALRDVPADKAQPILITLAKSYDGKDRAYLEAWGIGAMGKETALWPALVSALGQKDPLTWTPAFARLTWRLHPAAAISAVAARAAADSLSKEERKLALDTLAFTPEAAAADAMLAVAKDKADPVHDDALWWLIKRSTDDWEGFEIAAKLKAAGIFDPDSAKLISIELPPPADQQIHPEDVLKLTGNAKNGAQLVTRCVMCHQINGQGVEFGPSLEGWGLSQPSSVIAEAILDPSKDIAHGYEGSEIVTKDGIKIDGMILAEGDIMIVRSIGGQQQYVPKSRIAKRTKLTRSLMLSGPQLGMSAQDVADIVAYLRSAPAKTAMK